jgi:hypothetical protein
MQSLRARRRRPLKPATLHNWQNCLDKWLLPALGETPLAQIGNAALRTLVAPFFRPLNNQPPSTLRHLPLAP